MPIEIKAYKCSFGCGRRILQSKSDMAKHEKTCFMNPETKSCRTCKHDYHHRYSHEHGHIVTCVVLGDVEPQSQCSTWEMKTA